MEDVEGQEQLRVRSLCAILPLVVLRPLHHASSDLRVGEAAPVARHSIAPRHAPVPRGVGGKPREVVLLQAAAEVLRVETSGREQLGSFGFVRVVGWCVPRRWVSSTCLEVWGNQRVMCRSVEGEIDAILHAPREREGLRQLPPLQLLVLLLRWRRRVLPLLPLPPLLLLLLLPLRRWRRLLVLLLALSLLGCLLLFSDLAQVVASARLVLCSCRRRSYSASCAAC